MYSCKTQCILPAKRPSLYPRGELMNIWGSPAGSLAAENQVRAKFKVSVHSVQDFCTLQLGYIGFTALLDAESAADMKL